MYLYLFSDCTSKIPFKNFVMEISVLSVLSVFKYIASIILKYYWCTFMFTGPIKLWNRKMALKQLYVYFMLLCKVNSWTINCVSCRLPIPGPTVLLYCTWEFDKSLGWTFSLSRAVPPYSNDWPVHQILSELSQVPCSTVHDMKW